MSTKQMDILAHMRTHPEGITQAIAYREYHTSRLAVAIDRLRRKGYEIETVMERGADPYGRNQYARYFLKEGDDD